MEMLLVPMPAKLPRAGDDGRNDMKKMLKATAVTLVLAAGSFLVAKSEAAPRSEYCDMAKSQRNPVAWNTYYNCLEKPAAFTAPSRKPERHAASPYCDMAKSQRNPVAWNQYYGCLSRR